MRCRRQGVKCAMRRPVPITYRIRDGQREVYWYDEGIFECFAGEDAGIRCCLIQSCCCAGYAHYRALGWVNEDLGEMARKAWYNQLVADAIRGVASQNVNGRTIINPFANTLATVQEIRADFQYFTIRERFANLLFGVWQKDKDGNLYLFWKPQDNPCQECLIQAFFSPCARCQETSAAMKWRKRKTGRPVRYANPLFCACGFEEFVNGQWINPPTSIPPEMQERGENLLNRRPPAGISLPGLAPTPLVALRV